MKMKQIAAMVAALISGFAFAENNVTIYGTLNGSVDLVSVSNGGLNNALVSSNSSNIGFKGVEDLGDGMKAIFQVESGAAIDASGGVFASRNSNVGLSSGYGTIFFGNWDSPYKQGRLDPWGNSGVVASYTGIMGGNSSGGFTNTSGSRQAFDRRLANSVHYWSPKINNFFVKAAYGAAEEKTSSQTPSLLAMNAGYDDGTLYVGYAYEEHDQYANSSSSDTGNRLATSYRLPYGATINFLYEQLKWSGGLTAALAKGNAVGGVNKIRKDSIYVAYIHPIGKTELRFAYGRDDGVRLDGNTLFDSKASQLSVGAGYALSKRTELYAMYSGLWNGKNSNNTFIGKALNRTGQNISGFSVGMKEAF